VTIAAPTPVLGGVGGGNPPPPPTPATPPPAADPTFTANGVTIDFNTALQIIDSALAVVGLNPNQIATSGINAGQTLGQYFWGQIVSQGITDETTIGEMVSDLLPQTGQFQAAFPGYQEAINNGYIRTVADYVSAEEGITAVLLQGGIPQDLINPATVGNLIAQGNSVNEVAERVQQGWQVYENAPAEVQNYFDQEFGNGVGGPAAVATTFLNPNIDPVTLLRMLGGAQVRGALAAANLPISRGLSQRLADQGVTYSAAQTKAQSLEQEAGLFQQTVGEQQSQKPIAGTTNANTPLTEANQGVAAAFGLSAAAMQQVHQAALARQAEFKGGGGAATTEAEGYSGEGAAKPF